MRITYAVLATLSLSLTLMAADFTGTWKLNLEKSKVPQNNDLAGATMTISQAGPNSYTTIIDTISKSGDQRHTEYYRIDDGKEHPAKGVGFKAEGVMEISQLVNASTRKITQKRDGKVTGEITSTLSPDGKVMTNHRTFGKVEDVLVFERQ
jgi:hypothetical protein